MMTIYEHLASLIQIFLWIWFIAEYFGNKSKKFVFKVGFLATWIICFFEISYINKIIVYDGLLSGIIVVTLIIYAQLCLKGSLYSHIYVTLYGTAILFSISSVALFITAAFSGMSISNIISDTSSVRVVLLATCRLLEFSVFKAITKIKKNYSLPKRDMKLFILIALFTWLATTIMMRAAVNNAGVFRYMFALSVILVGMNFVIYYFSVKINNEYEMRLSTELQKQQYEQQISSQSKHLDEILIAQKQLKSFRHDIGNHFIAISGYFESSDYKGGMKYIDGIRETITNNTDSVDTGNIALDAIISTKKTIAQSKGIEFVSNLQIPERLNINAIDLCIIFGNALDNAIEACEKIEMHRTIIVSAVFDDNQLICKITNTAKPEMSDLQTTKADKENHGFGLANVKQALSKYSHVLKIDQTDKEFILSFIIFNR